MQPNSNIDGLPGTTRSLQSQGLASGTSGVPTPRQPKGMHLSQRIKRLSARLVPAIPGSGSIRPSRVVVLSSYFPRLVTSRLFRRVPDIRYYGAALTSPHLAVLLQNLNAVV